LIIGIVAIIVVGPRKLPSLLRNAGHMIGKVRRMALDLRADSGIDEILEVEGLRNELDNFRRLAAGQITLEDLSPNVVPDRDREYPRIGCDSYGAVSEDLVPYLPSPEPSAAPPAEVPSGSGGENGGSPPATTSSSTPPAELPSASLSPSDGAGPRTDA